MKGIDKELEALRDSVAELQNSLKQTFEERRLEMAYEREKMRYECGFNARNIIIIGLLLLALCSPILCGLFIHKYFEFETTNTAHYIEVQNVSDNNAMLYSNIAGEAG